MSVTTTTMYTTSGTDFKPGYPHPTSLKKKHGLRPLTAPGSQHLYSFIDFTPSSRHSPSHHHLATLEEEEPEPHHAFLPPILISSHSKRSSIASSVSSDRTLMDTLTVFSRDSDSKSQRQRRPHSSHSQPPTQTFISLGPTPVGPMVVDKALLNARRPGSSSGYSVKSQSTSRCSSGKGNTKTSPTSISPRLSVYPEGSPPPKRKSSKSSAKFRDAVGTRGSWSDTDLKECLGFVDRKSVV